MNKQSIVLSLATVITGTLVFADTCTTQYGGTTTCQATDLVINKQVENPVTRDLSKILRPQIRHSPRDLL